MSGHTWKNEKGEVVVAVWNDEYLLFLDFDRGIQVDYSPNHENIRWSQFLTPRTFEEITEEYGLEMDGPPDPYVEEAFAHFPLELIQEYIYLEFITRIKE